MTRANAVVCYMTLFGVHAVLSLPAMAVTPALTAAIASGVPQPDAVLAEMRDADDIKTAQRQIAALDVWIEFLGMVEIAAQAKGIKPDDGNLRRFRLEKQQFLASLDKAYSKNGLGCNGLFARYLCVRIKVDEGARDLYLSLEFKKSVLDLHLPPAIVTDHVGFLAQIEARRHPELAQGTGLANGQAPRLRELINDFDGFGLKIFKSDVGPWRWLGKLAAFSLIWLVPAFLFFIREANDRNVYETDSGHAYTMDGQMMTFNVKRRTGEVVEGDVNRARYAAMIWTLLVPMVVLYLPVLMNPQMPPFIFKIVVPLALLALIVWVAYRVAMPRGVVSRLLLWCWRLVVWAGIVNLIGWLLRGALLWR